MMPSRLLASILISSMLLLGSASIVRAETSKIRVVTLMDFKPFIWCENGTPLGIDVDIIKTLFAQARRPYSLECQPWKRALNLIKTGNADMLLSAYMTEERKQFAHFSALPVHLSSFNLFVPQHSRFEYRGINSLRGKLIGIASGFSLGPEFDSAREQNEFSVISSHSVESGLRMLLNGRIDIYINIKDMVRFTAKEMEISNAIRLIDKPLNDPRPAYYLFSKTAVVDRKLQLLDQLNESLAQIWSDGTIERIVDSYTVPDPDQSNSKTPMQIHRVAGTGHKIAINP